MGTRVTYAGMGALPPSPCGRAPRGTFGQMKPGVISC